MSTKKYTVTEITNNIKYLLEGNPNLKGIVLRGEISNFTKHYSGHLYFSLKDENAQIRAIMFKNYAEKNNFIPKDGMKVEVVGSINVYAPQGSYSLQISSMKEEGEGELYLKYLELKKNLQELGWFDQEPKVIPKFPKRIGVVTSATGAVIQDISNTVNRRYKLTEIILYSAAVQGLSASSIIAKQIKRANAENLVDVLIVGRGGGSIEDLWPFNEIETIEAIHTSKIPIITAIGHETDTTISDFVADLRAPTPTAAAELATPNMVDLINDIKKDVNVIKHHMNNLISQHQANLIHMTERLEQNSPLRKVENNKDKLNNLEKLLNYYAKDKLQAYKNLLNQLELKLLNLNPSIKLKENFDKTNLLKEKLMNLYNYKVERKKDYLISLISRIKSPERLINYSKDNLVKLNNQLNNNYQIVYNTKLNKYHYQLDILEKVNPLAIMKRGFAVIKDTDNQILTSIKNIEINNNIKVELIDGLIDAKIINKKVKE
ncbi:MAG TPA: exodeoxyribonuclease VII large subunit [Acholeplasmataceae bacterium]|nr:exodeoxyribonuclease VII large subunit [Acholeplasmataceae bacterium]